MLITIKVAVKAIEQTYVDPGQRTTILKKCFGVTYPLYINRMMPFVLQKKFILTLSLINVPSTATAPRTCGNWAISWKFCFITRCSALVVRTAIALWVAKLYTRNMKRHAHIFMLTKYLFSDHQLVLTASFQLHRTSEQLFAVQPEEICVCVFVYLNLRQERCTIQKSNDD